MTTYTSDEQWRSFQTFIAAYVAGMLHARDVFTISRASTVLPPLMEFRSDGAVGGLWFSMGVLAWSDQHDASILLNQDDANQIAAQSVQSLRTVADVNDPSDLRLSGSGPASSVAVLANAGFMSGNDPDPARVAAQQARIKAGVDVQGDVIDAVARKAGHRAFHETKSASTASIAFAAELARLRSWVDPFSPTPSTGYLVGGVTPTKTPS